MFLKYLKIYQWQFGTGWDGDKKLRTYTMPNHDVDEPVGSSKTI